LRFGLGQTGMGDAQVNQIVQAAAQARQAKFAAEAQRHQAIMHQNLAVHSTDVVRTPAR